MQTARSHIPRHRATQETQIPLPTSSPTVSEVPIAALGQVINEFAQPDVPPSPEQFASIAQALAGEGEGTHYATAGQWLDALAEYVTILVGDIGWPADESVAFAMGKYGPAVTEAGTISVTAFIQMYLEGLID